MNSKTKEQIIEWLSPMLLFLIGVWTGFMSETINWVLTINAVVLFMGYKIMKGLKD